MMVFQVRNLRNLQGSINFLLLVSGKFQGVSHLIEVDRTFQLGVWLYLVYHHQNPSIDPDSQMEMRLFCPEKNISDWW